MCTFFCISSLIKWLLFNFINTEHTFSMPTACALLVINWCTTDYFKCYYQESVEHVHTYLRVFVKGKHALFELCSGLLKLFLWPRVSIFKFTKQCSRGVKLHQTKEYGHLELCSPWRLYPAWLIEGSTKTLEKVYLFMSSCLHSGTKTDEDRV